MRMLRHSSKALVSALVALLPLSAFAAWTKSYVVEWNEPAMYYGAKTGVIDPGTDCPNGTNPEIDWIKVLVDAGYTRSEAEWLRNPANPTRSPVHGQNQMAFRGKDRANVYVNPTSVADPGLVSVSGTIAEGVDLDGNKKTGFTSPTGEQGIDNNFYKALGCWKTYRGPQRLSSGALQFNDGMRNGSWTTVIVVSGKGADPMNDKHVEVGLYVSDDKIVKDGNGSIASDYTFRIKPHAKYEALFPARTLKGRIVSTDPADVMLRDPSYSRDLELLKARVDLEMKADGSLKGYVGGYRPWEPVYQGWVNARGPVIEALTWVQLPAVWYALRRNADYSPPGAHGEKTHISFALRVDALPAYVMTPDAATEVAQVQSYKGLAKPEPETPYALPFRIVDGIVIDSKAKIQAGPTAVILASAVMPAPAVTTLADDVKPIRVSGLGIRVSDLERSKQFYTEVLGLKVDARVPAQGDAVEYLLGMTGNVREDTLIVIRKGEVKPGATEFGSITVVVPDGRKMAERVVAAGYPSARSIVDGTNFVKDPDGYTIELYQRPKSK
jgi:catechol 2,3-dioxygenase-like lactoylglutathione lyase family enzyme